MSILQSSTKRKFNYLDVVSIGLGFIAAVHGQLLVGVVIIFVRAFLSVFLEGIAQEAK